MADCNNLTWAVRHQGPGDGSSLVWLILFSAMILLSLVTNSIHILGVILSRRLSPLNGLLMLIFVNNIVDYSLLAFEFFLGTENQFPFANQSCAAYQALNQTSSILSSFYLVLYCINSTKLRSKTSEILVSVFLVTVLGTRVLGKLGLLTVPVTFMLLVSLVIRACLAGGGTLGILTLLAPDWAHLTSPASWMVAVAQVTSDSDSVNKYNDEDYPLRSSSVSSSGWAPCLPTPVTTATITTSCGTPSS